MKRSCVVSKGSALNDHPFTCRSPLLKAVSLGTAMTALLSSVSPVIASTFSPIEQQTTIQSSKSSKGAGIISLESPDRASKNFHGSAFTSDHYCGVDNILISISSDSRKIISEENYVNLLTHHQFDNCSSHGFGVQRAIWTVNGQNTVLDVSETSVLNDVLKKIPRDEPSKDVNGTLLPSARNIAIGLEAQALGANPSIEANTGAIAIGMQTTAHRRSIALGTQAAALDNGMVSNSGSVAIGFHAEALDGNSVALGSASLTRRDGIALGYNTSSRFKAIAIGSAAEAKGEGAIAIGYHATSEADKSIALGFDSVARVRSSYNGYDPLSGKYLEGSLDHIWRASDGILSIGDEAKKKTRQIIGVAAGREDTDAVNVAQLKALRELVTKDNFVEQEEGANGSGRIIIGSKVGGTEVNFANKDHQGRTLSGLKDGALSENSTEAVTGKQLYKVDSELTKTTKKVSDVSETIDGLSTSVSGLSTSVSGLSSDVFKVKNDVSDVAKNTTRYLGGGADVLSGKIPTYKIQGGNYKDVGAAFAGVDGSITDLYSKISNGSGGGLVQQEEGANGSGRIIIGSKVGGTEVNFENKDKKGRTLSGLKDGLVSEASTEAVTGKQLYKVDSELTKTTKKVSDVSKTVEGLSTSVSSLSTNVKQVQGDVSKIAKNASDYLGGGANVLVGTAPTYKVQGKNYQNVGTAFAGVDVSITDLYSKISNGSGGGLVQQEEGANDSGRIIIGSKVGGTEVNFENKDKKGRTLSGLKDGTLSEASTEAVTGKQLYKVDSELTKTTKKVSDVSKTVEGLSTSVSGLSTNVKKVEGDVSAIAKNASDYLGGGANVLDGTAPTYKVQGKNYQNVGTAFAGVDVSITDIYSKIASVGGVVLLNKKQVKKAMALSR
ncbi:hypothetical protein [Bartonella sp. C271]|uniref:hypothetical protein n=1 Tax=Bartonella sp. C271 TaxID=3070220 RepID=UPI003D816DF3